MICFDFECTSCQHRFEELLSKDEAYPKCPQCQGETQKCMGNTPFFHSPKYWEIQRKANLIKKKMTGQIPWRKNSESQSD